MLKKMRPILLLVCICMTLVLPMHIFAQDATLDGFYSVIEPLDLDDAKQVITPMSEQQVSRTFRHTIYTAGGSVHSVYDVTCRGIYSAYSPVYAQMLQVTASRVNGVRSYPFPNPTVSGQYGYCALTFSEIGRVWHYTYHISTSGSITLISSYYSLLG